MGEAPIIYCLGGLGVDVRAFEYLKLYYPNNISIIQWIQPYSDESINNYAKRIVKVNNLTDDILLLGVSFGGIIGVEICKIIKPRKFFLLSSISHKGQKPILIRVCSLLKLHYLIPFRLLKISNFVTFYFFGIRKNRHKKLLKVILRETDILFLKWAIRLVMSWNNTSIISHIVIHGSKDRIFPSGNLESKNYLIQGGGHFMIITHAKEIAKILEVETNQN